MSETPVTPATLAAIALELFLMLAGLALLWRTHFSPAARARPPARHLTVWAVTWVDFLMFLWYIVLCAFIFQTAAVYLLRKAGQVDAQGLLTTQGQVLAGLAFQLGVLAGCAAFRYLRPPRPTFDYFDPAPEAAQRLPFAAGLTTFLIMLPLLGGTAFVWQGLLRLGGFAVEPQSLVGVFAESESPAFSSLLIFFAIVVAPVTEELVFRRGLFRFARQHLPRWAALLVPALIFAALHQNLASFAPLVVLGVVFSLAYERTGNIAVTMIAHGIFNLNSVFLIYAGVNQ
jgi:membrane protease YdiL (CAAX protease family)